MQGVDEELEEMEGKLGMGWRKIEGAVKKLERVMERKRMTRQGLSESQFTGVCVCVQLKRMR